MAEVANLPQAPASEHSSVSATTLAADIPVENNKNEVNDLPSSGQPGTSPNHEKSSNSHHHDSEYDTASDLEGGAHGDYDDDDDDDDDDDGDEEEDDDDDDDSLEDVGNTDTDSLEFDAERQRGDGQETTDYTKKVDEDRSNPQYIPKKGTFYEHDDRTADEPEGTLSQVTEISEDGEISALSPTISQASKTMKKWQPASGGDRWSHDRFDASEQAPKSRSELVSAYGYDIRNEDGPPRARRRRRYARGPSKYSRNWEDETAYIKASNAQRKPPKPEDFPALEERQKARKSRSYRDEKENRFDRPQADRPRIGGQQVPNRENKEHIKRSTGNTKHFRTGNRQPAMDFKNKSRSSGSAATSHANSSRGSNTIDKDFNIVRSIVNQPTETNVDAPNFQKLSNNKAINAQPTLKVINQQPYNGYDHGQQIHQSPQSVNNSSSGGYNTREIGEKFSNSHSSHSRQTNSSNLSARLQQAQNRNDPSHVGSIQMHTLANQHNSQVANQNALQNNMLDLQPQPQPPTQQVVNQQEHARTKRYSSLRQRSQHDPTGGVASNQHLDQHALQQLQMQHEVQQQQQIATNVHTPQQIMLQEQHLIQANLMQLYHQENLQAQMQALQVSGMPQTSASQQPAAGKQPYTGIPQQYSAASSGPPAAAYYTPTAPDYSSPPPAAGPPPAQYPQQPTAFLQPQSASAPLAFNPTATQSLSQTALAPTIAAPASAPVPPGTVNYVQSASQNPSATPSAAYPNYANYQNFNTVGGTTYFVPSPQPTARPVVLPQRRPTNAIPILPPSEKTKRIQENKEDESKNNSMSGSTPSVSSTSSANAPIGSAENIDHILDNMFVQRPPYQPQTRKSSSPPNDDSNKSSTTSSIGAAAVQPDPAKSRTHDSSAKLPLQDIEPSITKQSAVSGVGTPNVIAMTTAAANADSGSTLAEAPLSESIPQ